MNIKYAFLSGITLLAVSCGCSENEHGGYGPMYIVSTGYYTAKTRPIKGHTDTKYDDYAHMFQGKTFVADHPSKAPSGCLVIPSIREQWMDNSSGGNSSYAPIAYWVLGCEFGVDYQWRQLIGSNCEPNVGEWYGESESGERVILNIYNTGTVESGNGPALSLTFYDVDESFELGEKTEIGYDYKGKLLTDARTRWFSVNVYDMVRTD